MINNIQSFLLISTGVITALFFKFFLHVKKEQTDIGNAIIKLHTIPLWNAITANTVPTIAAPIALKTVLNIFLLAPNTLANCWKLIPIKSTIKHKIA
jgi:hypothetical protein